MRVPSLHDCACFHSETFFVTLNKETTREVQETIKKLKGDQKCEVVSPINERSYFELIMQGR